WVSSGNVNSLSAAYTLLALDAYAKASGTTLKFTVSEVDKDGKERALALSAGAIQKASISQAASRVQLRRDGQLPGFYALNDSGFDRTAPTTALSQGVEIIREVLDMKGNQ